METTPAPDSPGEPITPKPSPTPLVVGGDDKEDNRREFLKKTACTLVGGGIVAAPLAASIVVLTDPLRREGPSADLRKVTTMDALPGDGTPVKFKIIADLEDAWNKFPDTPVGSVYLRRIGEDIVQAFNSSCPHAGCAVEYMEAKDSYYCPCHQSTFAVDGTINDPKSPSVRGLDTLESEIREGGEIWVKFQNFKAGIKEKKPIV